MADTPAAGGSTPANPRSPASEFLEIWRMIEDSAAARDALANFEPNSPAKPQAVIDEVATSAPSTVITADDIREANLILQNGHAGSKR